MKFVTSLIMSIMVLIFSLGISQAKEDGDGSKLAKSEEAKGYKLYKSKNYEEAAVSFLKALKILEKTHKKGDGERVRLAGALGESYYHAKNYDAAETYLIQAINESLFESNMTPSPTLTDKFYTLYQVNKALKNKAGANQAMSTLKELCQGWSKSNYIVHKVLKTVDRFTAPCKKIGITIKP